MVRSLPNYLRILLSNLSICLLYLYEKTLSGNGILIMGNEGNGIRPAIEAFVNEKLYIPNYPEGRDTSESLNVAIATAVVCAEFRRRQGNPA